MNRIARIRALNDALRTKQKGGHCFLTAGVAALDWAMKRRVLNSVRTYVDFEEGNDPYGEHDFGVFEIDGDKFYFKIDYYSADLHHAAEDPADPVTTHRILTIMFASEY